ncbi:BlaI/MecI/CopY family transcriptional regulator [Curtobacterium sp. VKM Ac-2922]|uniref:BlaI/MecI/CopY family transcriptional regulator n=1 Tax=Curtobacterium sp. VKM Ac-2922 TaxID=2929475 RepID=UPI001FB3AD28|nr:BlaI/MecI/CopY family transcriptional regulator [Curtobacterium sp. VKM Ac-2922]MCJ1712938.1 BlaI/MecI/CopY family transcriptional regulator [Curtobacterium sp. VKM Ac-2922]
MSAEPRGLAGQFGPLEFAILEALWAGGESSVAECAERLSGGQAYTTVKTVMERMTVKGLLVRRKESRAYRYDAARTRDEMNRDAAERTSRELLAGFGSVAVSSFVDAIDPTSPEFDDLVARLRAIAGRDEE